LEFQASKRAATEEKENSAPVVPTKPPLDLFKEIFADSSSESEEEESPPEPSDGSLKSSQLERIGNSSSSLGKIVMDSKPRERDDSRRDKAFSDRRIDRRFDREDKPEILKEREKKGIFDDLDLNNLSSIKKDSSKTEDEQEDEEHEIYGPRAPIKPLSSSSIGNGTSQGPSHLSSFSPNITSASSSSAWLLSRPIFSSATSRTVGRKDEDVVWVEKEKALKSSSSKVRKHSIKKSKKSKKAKSRSKHKDAKQKKTKKHKSKKSKLKKSASARYSDDSSSSSSEEDDRSKSQKKGKTATDDSSDDSSSSVKIYGSLDQKALLQQLKQISRSHLSPSPRS
jgi:hypothetical protein